MVKHLTGTKTVHLPAVSGNDTPIEVRGIEKDRGTAWARGLKPEQVAGLVDLASELTSIVSPQRKNLLAQRAFYDRLSPEIKEQAIERMAQLIGFHSERTISIYNLWWAAVWAAKYTACSLRSDKPPEKMHAHVCNELGLRVQDAYRLLMRRDISYIVGLFFERAARERKGDVMWSTTIKALEGSPKHQQLYYDKVIAESVGGKETGGEHNFDRMTEEELMKFVQSRRRLVGEPFGKTPEIEIKEVEFEVAETTEEEPE